MRKNCPFSIALSSLLFAISPNIVISQVQVGTSSNTDNEFIELINNSNLPVDLTGFRLTKRTASGTQSNLVASISGTLQPQQYFLIAHPSFSFPSITPDLFYSATSSGIAANNTITLYSDAGLTLVDKLGYGTATSFEGSPAANPLPGQSLTRVGIDTDNNLLDFQVSDNPIPHNTSFISPTPTPIPTPIPTATPDPTSIPLPTPTSTPSLEPTPSATPTPTTTPTPSPAIRPQNRHHDDDHEKEKSKHETKLKNFKQKFFSFCRHFFYRK